MRVKEEVRRKHEHEIWHQLCLEYDWVNRLKVKYQLSDKVYPDTTTMIRQILVAHELAKEFIKNESQ